MAYVNKINTDSNRGALNKGELGLDVYEDANKMYVGYVNSNGTPVNIELTAHADKLVEAKTIKLTGEITGEATTDLSNGASISTELTGPVKNVLTVDSSGNNDNVVELRSNEVRLWRNRNDDDATSSYTSFNQYDLEVKVEIVHKDKDGTSIGKSLVVDGDNSKLIFGGRNIINAYGSIGDYGNQTVYVDADNGDDNNNGVQGSPFKTIQRAIKVGEFSGGVVDIYCDNRQVHLINSNVDIYGVACRLVRWDNAGNGDKFQVDLNTYLDDDEEYSHFNYFNVSRNAALTINNCEFVGLDKVDGKDFKVDDYTSTVVNIHAGLWVYMDNCEVDLSNSDNASFVSATRYYNVSPGVNIYNCDITLGEDTKTSILNNRWSTPVVFQRTGGSLDYDEDDRQVKHIARDGDSGNPINVISNINFSS